MKNYQIRLLYGASVLESLDTCDEEFTDLSDLYQRAVVDEEFDVCDEKSFTESINELYINDEEYSDGWQEEFRELKIPSEGLYRTGGWCRGAVELELSLPDEEEFDISRLVIKDRADVSYHLLDGRIIEAEYDEDADEYDDGESGDTYYYNGVELEDPEE